MHQPAPNGVITQLLVLTDTPLDIFATSLHVLQRVTLFQFFISKKTKGPFKFNLTLFLSLIFMPNLL
jgi:hypothetical protein